MQRRDFLKSQIDLARKGYELSARYANSNLPEHLREEGRQQTNYYYNKIIEALTELYRVNH